MQADKTNISPILQILLHVGVWSLIYFFPLLVVDSPKFQQHYLSHSSVSIGFYLLVFYCNYFLLIQQQLFTRKYLLFVLINVLLITFSIIAMNYLYWWIFHTDVEQMTRRKSKFPHELVVFRNVLMFLFVIGVAISVLAIGHLGKQEQRFKTIETERLKAELIYLRYQLQPHFFFNTLNNIYALIDAHPDRAKATVHRLSKLMRYILYNSDESLVSIREELQFLNHYIELMRIRFGKHVKIDTLYPEMAVSGKIPPLLIVPLLENAFKHGVDASAESKVDIQVVKQELELEVRIINTFFPKEKEDKSGSGIGLENLRKRLELLFPQKNYTLLTETDKNFYIATLKFPIHHD